ncbi:unnamed protein product [Calypogeia fissa]
MVSVLVTCCSSSALSVQRSGVESVERREVSPNAPTSVVYLKNSLNPKFPVTLSSTSSRIVARGSKRSSQLVAPAIGPSGLGPTSDPTYEGPSDEITTAVKEDTISVEDLKQTLVDTLYGTERGLRASSETRGEIVEIITQLESKNPTAAPTEAVNLLNGKWILAYTSFSELFPLLAAGNLPLVKVGEISQTFDSTAFTIQNTVSFTGPLATTSFSNSGIFEVRSPKRVQVKFEEGVIGTPQLTDSIEIPDSVEVLGQKVDLVAFQGILRPLQDAATSVVRTISGQPPIKFPIQADKAQSWLLTTYLDEDLRISRGDGGSLFVLLKEGSPLLL